MAAQYIMYSAVIVILLIYLLLLFLYYNYYHSYQYYNSRSSHNDEQLAILLITYNHTLTSPTNAEFTVLFTNQHKEKGHIAYTKS